MCAARSQSSAERNLRLPDFLGDLGKRKVFQVAGIAIELADTLCQLLRSHRVFVVHPPKCLLVEVETLFLACLRYCRIELTLQRSFGLLQLPKKLWADGQQIRSGQV